MSLGKAGSAPVRGESGRGGGAEEDAAPGAWARARAALWPFALLELQLGLLVIAIGLFRIESRAFLHLSFLIFGGFSVHYWLPARWRLPFFLALSLAGIALVLGAANAFWVVLLGLGLIGLCHVPVSFRVRGALLLGAGACLAALRASGLSLPWSPAIWPILGAMFMFRLIVYFYDLRHDRTPPRPLQTLSYFFLLPNVCFPLFPVIDFATFRKTYYAAKAELIHQRGLRWMLRGIVQLVLYRAVYYYGTISPAEVDGPLSLLRYLVTNFALYLRVSGQFHLIVGILHLFGFHLPETNHRYVLASSFTDFWRRINIYWKDFMLKVFYYPAYFRLRRSGATRALVLATLFVFAVTWLLHSYQWFWLRGTFPITWQDVLFWGALAGLVVYNTLREAGGRARTARARAPQGARAVALQGLRVVGTFATICALWSLWTSESLSAWIGLWRAGLGGIGGPSPAVWRALALGAAALAALAALAWALRGASARIAPLWEGRAVTIAGIAAVCLLGAPASYGRLGPSAAGVIDSLRETRLSDADAARLERGYYENLIDVDRFNSQLWEVYMRRPADWPAIRETQAGRMVQNFSKFELVPSVSFTYLGHPFATNRWAMRDRDYEQARPPGTFRAALVGSSHAMGSGVGNGEIFESLLEARLERERPAPFEHFEVLNFAVGGYTPLQQLQVLRERVFPFEPQALFYVAHEVDRSRAIHHLAEAVRYGVEIPYPFLQDVLRRAGIDGDTPMHLAERRLEPFGSEVLGWLYRELVQACRERGITPIWLLIPIPLERTPESVVHETVELAREAGFLVVEETFHAYDGVDPDGLVVAEWDSHPNARGHQILADALFDALVRRRAEVFAAPPRVAR